MRSSNVFFKIGFLAVTLIFIVLNVVSFVSERAQYFEGRSGGIRIAHGGYSWGFPMKMYRNFLGNPNVIGFEAVPTAINKVAVVVTAGLAGLILEALATRIRKVK